MTTWRHDAPSLAPLQALSKIVRQAEQCADPEPFIIGPLWTYTVDRATKRPSTAAGAGRHHHLAAPPPPRNPIVNVAGG